MSDTNAFQPQQYTGSYGVPTLYLATLSFPGALITKVATVTEVMRGWGFNPEAVTRGPSVFKLGQWDQSNAAGLQGRDWKFVTHVKAEESKHKLVCYQTATNDKGEAIYFHNRTFVCGSK